MEKKKSKILFIFIFIFLALGIFTLTLSIFGKCNVSIPLSFICITNALLVIQNLKKKHIGVLIQTLLPKFLI